MKRYLLFQEPDYYPSGGLSDVLISRDSLEELTAYMNKVTNMFYLSDTNYIWDRIEDKYWDIILQIPEIGPVTETYLINPRPLK